MKRHIPIAVPLEFKGKGSQARLLIHRLSNLLGEVERGATLPSDFVSRLFRWKQLVVEDVPEITQSVEDLARYLVNLTRVDLTTRQKLVSQALRSLAILLEQLPRDSGAPAVYHSREIRDEHIAGAPTLVSSRITSGKGLVTPKVGSVEERKRLPATPKLSDPLRVLGQTPQRYQAALDRLGLHVVEDLLWHLPRRYVDYSRLVPIAQIRPGQEVTVRATVQHIAASGGVRSSLRRVEAHLSDVTGSCTAVWFGQEWRIKQEALQPGNEIFVSGKVRLYGGKLQFTHPDFEPVGKDAGIHTGRLVPIYPLSGDLSGAWLRVRVKRALDTCLQQIQENLPLDLLALAEVPSLSDTLLQIHFPDNTETLISAQRRIALNRLLPLQIGLLQQRREWQRKEAIPLPLSAEQRLAFQEKLPFTLTPGQLRALDEILTDLAASHPMGRLLQGDVGSGKTVVAAMAALAAVENGAQVAVIAPTEILAEQHAATFAKLFAPIHELLRPILLTGSLSAKVRRDMWKLVGSGQARVVVGTQSLLNEEGTFARLALVIVDEQHRFGVYQRDALWRKGVHPHLLAMTATPIPRTLALVQFSDLDLSRIDSLPVGRKSVDTKYVPAEQRDRLFSFVRQQINEGRQAYVICPLVEEHDSFDVRAAKVELTELRQHPALSDLRLGLLHGGMKAREKERVMREFRDGAIDVLVATTVVEVGVDVPNATIMVIEGAERFGLAQLHQLRGRVGRSVYQSYCALVPSEDASEEDIERLQLVAREKDGLRLAEADLQRRGAGMLFGDQQSGHAQLVRWLPYIDLETLRRCAQHVIDRDPHLVLPEHHALRSEVMALFEGQIGEVAPLADAADTTASLSHV